MSEKDTGEVVKLPDYPLFGNEAFLLPPSTRQGVAQDPDGWYHPVSDTLYLQYPNEEVVWHETIHRIFSVLSGGSLALRRLAGISHSLLCFLLHTISEKRIQLVGRNLETLRSESSDRLIGDIVTHLKYVNSLYNICHAGLVPVAEIAAIDFIPDEGVHAWLPVNIEDSEENRNRQKQQVNAVANWLAEKDFNRYSPRSGDDNINIGKEFITTWDDYTSIDNPFNRLALLQLTMNTILETYSASPDDKEFYAVNTLDFIRNRVEEAKKLEAIKSFHIERFHRHRKIRSILREISRQVLDSLPSQFHKPAGLSIAVDSFLMASHPAQESDLSKSQAEYETASSPYASLLTFRIEHNGRKHVLVNQSFLVMVEEQLVPGIPALEANWWRELSFFETLRLAIKYGKSVICPFRGWEGVSCNQECPIRKYINQLQLHTELVKKGATCLDKENK